MPCSPLLKGVDDPAQVLRIAHDHPILCHSEPPEAFYPLQERGWVEYKGGCWRITKEGYAAMPAKPEERPKSLTEFFDL